jgi:hypothetical protein
VNPSGWVTAGAEGLEPSLAPAVEDALGHNAARRVAGAEEQNVEHPTGGAHDRRPVLLEERLPLRIRQDIEDLLRGAAKLDAQRCHDDRTIDQDRVTHHEVDKLVVGPFRVIEAELVIGCPLAAQHVTRRDAHAIDQVDKLLTTRRRLQVLDDRRLFA